MTPSAQDARGSLIARLRLAVATLFKGEVGEGRARSFPRYGEDLEALVDAQQALSTSVDVSVLKKLAAEWRERAIQHLDDADPDDDDDVNLHNIMAGAVGSCLSQLEQVIKSGDCLKAPRVGDWAAWLAFHEGR